jgi:hypothetical protein
MSRPDSESKSEPTPVLSGWKGIGRYLGKGVRTVQRWERELGLPVRRTKNQGLKSAVLALQTEIDAWVREQRFQEGGIGFHKSDRIQLLRSLARLRSENRELRRQLANRTVSRQ